MTPRSMGPTIAIRMLVACSPDSTGPASAGDATATTRAANDRLAKD